MPPSSHYHRSAARSYILTILAIVVLLSVWSPAVEAQPDTDVGTEEQSSPDPALSAPVITTGSGANLNPQDADSTLLNTLLYAPDDPVPTPTSQPYSSGLAGVLYEMQAAQENIMTFDGTTDSAGVADLFSQAIGQVGAAAEQVGATLCWGGATRAYKASGLPDEEGVTTALVPEEAAILPADSLAAVSCEDFPLSAPEGIRHVEVHLRWDVMYPALPAPEHASGESDTGATMLPPVVDMRPGSPAALAEVVYAFRGEPEKVLGILGSSNRGAASFVLPASELRSRTDLHGLVVTVRRVYLLDDLLPDVIVDAAWLAVERGQPEPETLYPPDTARGDILIFEAIEGDYHARLVLRNPAPPAPSTGSGGLLEGQDDGADQAGARFPLAVSRPTAGSASWLRELWLWHEPSLGWTRVAIDDSMAPEPDIHLMDGQLFWIGPRDGALWHFHPLANATDSASSSASGSIILDYAAGTGERRRALFDVASRSMTFTAVPSPTPLP